LGLSALLAGCLPAYDNHRESLLVDAGSDGSVVMDADTCASSGKLVAGRVFSWGPAAGMSSFKGGIRGNVVGYDCLQGDPSDTIKIQIPIPKAVLNDGKEYYVDLRGKADNQFDILHMMYGPYVFNDKLVTDSADSAVFMHAILDQPGNLRDTINQTLGITLGMDTSWIYGAFLNGITGDSYSGSVITIQSPPAAKASCKIYYTCEFSKAASGIGTCADGSQFVKAIQNAFSGLFLITCPINTTGPLVMTATDGQDVNGITKTFPQITVPISSAPNDVTFPEWRPN
jgi:hypothetical protein